MSAATGLIWYWNRLSCMSAGEVGFRVYQQATSWLQRLGFATARRVPAIDLSPTSVGFIGVDVGETGSNYSKAADAILDGKLRVFDLEYVFDRTLHWNRDPKTGTVAPLEFGKTLDYRDESVVGDIKYLWEPNRHLHLVTLAQAYRVTGELRYIDALRHQLESWLDQCPYLQGPNWTSSLELAIRLINWSVAWQLIGGIASQMFAGTNGALFRDRWLHSIYQHMHFVRGNLSRYSSANNHLIGELSGLFVGCVTWPYWRETIKWREVARARLEHETTLQNAVDGVNREQAISYQQFVLDFLLFAGLAGRANNNEFSQQYWKRIESMLEFLASAMDVNGNVPMIGDADDGYVVHLSTEAGFCPYRSLLATGAVVYKRGDFKAKAGRLDDKTRWLCGRTAELAFSALEPDASRLSARREFREGGYYVLGSDFETHREIRAIADAGPLGYLSIAAHGHADALAFTLSVGGREFLIDPGTYTYGRERKWRDYFRGTGAHNTVVVDGLDQSESGGNFMWLRKAGVVCEAWETTSEIDRFVGSHDGYTRLSDPVVHRREIVLHKRMHRLLITDILECTDQHRAESRWHFSELCEVSAQGDTLFVSSGGVVISLRLADSSLRFEIHRGEEDPPCGWVSRRFDVKVPAVTAVVLFPVDGRTVVTTEIGWQR